MPSTRKVAKPPQKAGNRAKNLASTFAGFPEAGFRLLEQLKRHNDRDWFREHKFEYKQLVEEPMQALLLSVSSACLSRQLPFYPKPKNPVMRVYRDIRFSADKTPFKTHVA